MSETMVTMVFTDLVNSTAVKNHLPGSDITARNRLYRDTILLPHRERVEASLAAYNGRKVETIGDAFFVVFPHPLDAIQWAVAIQLNHINEPIPTPLGTLQLKIGTHTGSPLADGDNFIGQEVDYAARIISLATGGQILLSEVTAACIRNANMTDLALHFHGERDLKGIGEVPIFELLYAGKQPQPLKDTEPIKFGGIGTVIDWRGSCRNMLAEKRRLTTNSLMTGEGLGFELDEIYVPLGLVERKQQPKYSSDVAPEQGSQLYESESADEITQTFQQEEFFEQVLYSGRSKRIAIIGEPGAGKTTLLQKIAAWILDNTPDLPIWISLADLQGKSLEQYLLQDWLKAATKKVHVMEALEEALGEKFNSGKVWLLLDAVDEMVTESGHPLAKIANQLTGWIADARVILTCRLNVWDVGKNALEAFDTYRNLDFSYGAAKTPDQVKKFIFSWFKSNSVLAENLRNELDRPGRERIKDAVKNPLRLALLCRTWARWQGELPQTKAGLYQQFIEALYEWKQDLFPTTFRQQQELNQALGQLSLQAISQEKTKFRLRHRFVESILGNADTGQFQLALQLGFLNQVGVAAETENRGEKVYAFYHPTLQEYFAAQAIHDWHYFLNPNPRNPLQGTYRIFEPQWKEIMLLWLGRDDVPKQQKDEFIQALIEFEDGCDGFYKYRAYFLAAALIAEFRECRFGDAIATQLVQWSFGKSQREKQEWLTLPITVQDPLKEGAKAALQETDRSKAIAALKHLLDTNQHQSTRWQAARILGQIEPGNQDAIATLIELLQSSEDKAVRYKAARILTQIGVENNETRTAFTQLLQASQEETIRFRFAWNLGLIDSSNSDALAVLHEMLHTHQDEFSRWQAARALGQILPGNSESKAALINLIRTSQSENIRAIAAWKLGEIDPGNSQAIATLIELLHASSDEYICWQAAETLGQIGTGSQEAIAALTQVLYTRQAQNTHYKAAQSLGKICNSYDEKVVAALNHLLHASEDQSIRYQAAESLGKIAPGNAEAINVLTDLLHTGRNEYIIGNAAQRLEKIDPGNEAAIATLIKFVQTSQRKNICGQAADCLKAIAHHHQLQTFVSSLKKCLQEEDHIRYEASYKVLWHCAQNLTYPTFYQAWHSSGIVSHPEVPETQGVGSTLLTQTLNLSALPRLLAAAIACDTSLSQNVNPVCINISKFVDPENPAAEIYIEMLEQGCPERQQGEPTTMQAFKVYWKLLKSDKRIVLVFYENPTGYEPQGFSSSFLMALSKLDGAIGIVTEQTLGNFPLQQFSPSQPNWLDDIVRWIKAIQEESL